MKDTRERDDMGVALREVLKQRGSEGGSRQSGGTVELVRVYPDSRVRNPAQARSDRRCLKIGPSFKKFGRIFLS